MSALYLYDDARAREFEPFSLTRPVSELVAGAELTRRRWELCAGTRATAFIAGEQLRDFEEFDAPRSAEPEETIPAGSIVANSRCVISLGARLGSTASTWLCAGAVAAVRLTRAIRARELGDGSGALAGLAALAADGPRAEVSGRWLTNVWDLIAQLAAQLTDDITVMAERVDRTTPPGTLGSWPALVEPGATIEPNVIFDTSAGPILVRAGATVAAFTRLVGPCHVARGATVLGDRVANCSIGESCKVRGEISTSVMLGHSNKGHTGFVGHSYMGRWVNLGSGSTTSNLKNTYGTVQLWTPRGMTDSGQQFLGTMFGDHVKTGIGTMLSTGTVLGAGASIHGAGMPPRVVPPFAWGDRPPYAAYDLDRFLEVAGRVAQRRGVALTARQLRQLASAHGNRWSA